MTIWRPDINAIGGPAYLAIAEALAQDVANGVLEPGRKLPTHRELAEALGVTVGTVTRGYKEAARRGLASGETGRGTFVSRGGGGDAPFRMTDPAEDRAVESVDFSYIPPLYGLDPDLGEALAEISQQKDVRTLLHYAPPGGRMRDRETGAAWARRFGVKTRPENVLYTVGAQHALCVLLSGLFPPGERLAVDAVSYPLFKTLAKRLHLHLAPVRMDKFGMSPHALETLCRNGRISAVYLMPSCQNPTTARLPEHRRHEIADIAERHGLFIIEDDAYALIANEPGAALAELAPERTFFIAAVSKSLAGGLRCAFLCAPEAFVPGLKNALSDSLWTAPPLMCEIVRLWLRNGLADDVIRRKRAEAAARVAVAREILGGLELKCRPRSLFAWLKLPPPRRAAAFEREAAERGVIVMPDDKFIVGRTPPPHAVRLALSCPPSGTILRKGLERIRDMLEGA